MVPLKQTALIIITVPILARVIMPQILPIMVALIMWMEQLIMEVISPIPPLQTPQAAIMEH